MTSSFGDLSRVTGSRTAPLRIASQFEPEFNTRLRAHSAAPDVVDIAPDDPRPLPLDADAIFIRPNPVWRQRGERPKGWPGRIRWVQTSSAGVDAFPAWLFDGPAVSCGRGVASEEIADYVIAAIYARGKDIEGARVRSRDQWRKRPSGRVLGTSLGLVGLGAIGQAVARRAIAMGMHVRAIRRRTIDTAITGIEMMPSLEALVAVSDHIALALPSTPRTYRMIDASVLAVAKPGAHLINVARGSIVDQNALLEALDQGILGFATLDVTDPEPLPPGHPIYTHDRIRLTPHISSNYGRARDNLFSKVLENFDRFLDGRSLLDLVDPTVGY